MNDAMEINGEGLDVERVVAEIKRRVAENRERGIYDDPAVARAEKHNLLNFKDDEAFMERYLTCLRHVVSVDINDFTIFERRPRFAWFLVRLKTLLWKFLRFYTYRLWSQQNEINGVLLAAIEVGENRSRQRIDRLEGRVAELERKLHSGGCQISSPDEPV